MRPYASGQAYQNYIDPALTTWRQAYYGANYTQLTQVKAKYDPDRVFSFPQATSRAVRCGASGGHDGISAIVDICSRMLASPPM